MTVPYTNTAGSTVEGSSIVTTAQTSVTVPQVQFTTAAPASSGAAASVGLAPGTPASNPDTTPTPTAGAGGSVGTTLSYSLVGSTAALAPTTSISPFTGAASGLSAKGSTFALGFGGLLTLLMHL